MPFLQTVSSFSLYFLYFTFACKRTFMFLFIDYIKITIMKRLFFIPLLAISILSNAQVTIGSSNPPHKDALLDLKEFVDGTAEKGLLMPRVSLSATNDPSPLSTHVQGMIVYNTTPSNTQDPAYLPQYHVSKGFYYNDGKKWEKMHIGATNWFYMPSVSFDTSVDATGQTKNLYELYEAQFSSPAYASSGAPAIVPHIPDAGDLYYYILAADPNVFQRVTIDENGLMTYDVKAAATDCTYISIVFVLK